MATPSPYYQVFSAGEEAAIWRVEREWDSKISVM